MDKWSVKKIISGGQVGADRAGLDFALAVGLGHGGWCPKGRISLDGAIPAKYQLQETDSADYPKRTRANVRDSDATLVVTTEPPGRGSQLTIYFCELLSKPCLIVTGNDPMVEKGKDFMSFLAEHRVETLNVAGARTSNAYETTSLLLRYVWRATSAREDPKRFLREVKAGVGVPEKTACGGQAIVFEDAARVACELRCCGSEEVFLEAAGEHVTLTPGMAQRLANSLERWALTGTLGGS